MRFFLNFLFYQVNRTAFYFHVCLCQILPQNTRTEKLYAAGHQDDAHQRRPAGHRISEDQLPYDDKYDHQKGNDAEQHAHKGSDQKRCRGKCGDTVKGIYQELPEIPLGLALGALYILIFQPFGAESYPTEDSFGKAVILTDRKDRIHHRSAHQPVITRSIRNLNMCQLSHHFIKAFRKEGPDRWPPCGSHVWSPHCRIPPTRSPGSSVEEVPADPADPHP